MATAAAGHEHSSASLTPWAMPDGSMPAGPVRFVFVFVLMVVAVAAQEPTRFEVASVKPATEAGGWRLASGEVDFRGAELLSVLSLAYNVDLRQVKASFDLRRVPKDMLERSRFDIQGKGEGDARAMLQTLLAERFALRTHREVRQVPIYAVTVKQPGTLGRWLKPSPHNCREILRKREERPEVCTFSRDTRFGASVSRYAGTLDDLVLREVVPRLPETPVINRTGLTGNYEWEIAVGLREQPDTPTVFTALEDQLGLKLEKTTGPWEVIVVDHIQTPTAN
jgi:uncharacterized protein (TIGR03435 family)